MTADLIIAVSISAKDSRIMDNITQTVKLADVDPDKAKKFAQRLHRKKDDIEITRKAAVADVSESSDDDRTIVARVSTPDRDRDGEIVEPKGIDLANFNANPILLWVHDYKRPPIGRALWSRIDGKGLLCKFKFAETAFADEIYTLYRDGFLKTFSIGFIPMEFDGKTKTHEKVSLLEVSAVPVPSNPMALVEASAKGLKLCDSLKHDLGLDAAGDTAIAAEPTAPETKEGAEVEMKILDRDGNPSIGDIWGAIDRALNGSHGETAPGEPPAPWYAVNEIFPVDFPNGHCIYTEYLRGREVSPMYQQDYEYSDSKATMTGDRTEVVVTYAEKAETDAAPETKAVPDADTTVSKTETLADPVAAALLALTEKVDALAARIAGPVVSAPVPEPDKTSDKTPDKPADFIDLEPEPDILEGLEISPAPAAAPAPPKSVETMTEVQVVEAVGKAIADLNIQSVIKEYVGLALDKARGRVR